MDDLSIFQSLAGLVTAFLLGGGLSKLLELLPAWKTWCPAANVKMFVVYVLTCLMAAAVVWLQAWLLPTYWVYIPAALKAFLLTLAAFLVSQYVRSNDKKSEGTEP